MVVSVSTTPLRCPGGAVFGVLSVLMDVNEHRTDGDEEAMRQLAGRCARRWTAAGTMRPDNPQQIRKRAWIRKSRPLFFLVEWIGTEPRASRPPKTHFNDQAKPRALSEKEVSRRCKRSQAERLANVALLPIIKLTLGMLLLNVLSSYS